MPGLSKNPEDYRDGGGGGTWPLDVALRRIAWGVFVFAVLLALWGCVGHFFAPLAHDHDEVVAGQRTANRFLVASAIVVAIAVALGLWSAAAYRAVIRDLDRG